MQTVIGGAPARGGERAGGLQTVACQYGIVSKDAALFGCIPGTEYKGFIEGQPEPSEKSTLKYIEEHYMELVKEFNHSAKRAGFGVGCTCDSKCGDYARYSAGTELLSELYMEMSRKPDYEIYYNEDGDIIPLEGYIRKTLSILCKRNSSNVAKRIQHEFIESQKSAKKNDDSDNTLNMFDQAEEVHTTENMLDDIIEREARQDIALDAYKVLRKERYSCGSDLFSIAYIMVKARMDGVDNCQHLINKYLKSDGLTADGIRKFQAKFWSNESIKETFKSLLECNMCQEIFDSIKDGVRDRQLIDSSILN